MNARWMYSEMVKDHFFHPRNIFREDEGFLADGMGEVGSPACGDIMRLLVQVDPKTDKITACRWSTFGCASAIASTSMLSEMITENGGMEIEKALKLSPKQILERLGGLPTQKVHCSVLGDQALRVALYDYFKKTEQFDRIPKNTAEEIVCACKQVPEKAIQEAVLHGARTLEQVQKETGAGTICGRCVPKLEMIIEKTKKEHFDA